MAAQTITLTEFARHLQGLSRQMPLGPLIKILRLQVISETRANFYEGHAPDGTPWKPLKHPRPNSKGSDKPLLDTGVLAASVTAAFAQGNINEETDRSFTWGTNLEHAETHQKGATITPKRAKYLAIPATMEAKRKGSPRNWPDGELSFRFGKRGGVATDLEGQVQYYFAKEVTIPARPFLGLTDEMESDFEETSADYAADWAAKQMGA